MITTSGSLHIKRYLAGFNPAIAQSIAYGIGNKAEAAADTKLQFEIGRIPISLTSYDFVTNRLVYKGSLPTAEGFTVYETALFSSSADAVAGEFGSRLISTFDSATESWSDATGVASTFAATTNRIGPDSLRQEPALSTSKTDVLTDLSIDFSGYSGNDKFVVAYNVANANTSALRIRFVNDQSNYFDINFGAQTTGYKIVEVNKSALTATGVPDWSKITQMQITTVASSSGAASVDFDGIRIEDADTINPEYVMVARELLPTAVIKEGGKIQEIESTLDVNV